MREAWINGLTERMGTTEVLVARVKGQRKREVVSLSLLRAVDEQHQRAENERGMNLVRDESGHWLWAPGMVKVSEGHGDGRETIVT